MLGALFVGVLCSSHEFVHASSSEQKAGAVLPRHVSCIAVRTPGGPDGLGTSRTLIRGDAKRPGSSAGETQEPGAFAL
jgi:hypothetical protein